MTGRTESTCARELWLLSSCRILRVDRRSRRNGGSVDHGDRRKLHGSVPLSLSFHRGSSVPSRVKNKEKNDLSALSGPSVVQSSQSIPERPPPSARETKRRILSSYGKPI